MPVELRRSSACGRRLRRRRHGTISSLASWRYASAAGCSGAKVVIGTAATDASGNFTVRPITVSSTCVAERLDDPLEHLAGVQRARVVHRGEDAVELDRRVEPVAHLLDRLDQQRDAAQGEVLALERDQHAVAAVSALTVRRPSEGWQSISTTS